MAMPINFSSPFQVQKKLLLEKTQATDAVLKACAGKKIFELVQHEVSRLDSSDEADEAEQMPVLSAAQQRAFDEIKNHFSEKQVALLHGVTSSGKTEIYMHLIEEALTQGKQVLYMLPEIALTAQLINRLKKVFRSVGVYHSKFSDAQRVEVYQNLLKNADKPTLILGVRSSLFLPFSNLGLVIVDEEHENTYKQQDPAPRYHARDTAIVMAARHGAKALLGSATPSIESYSNAISGKYGLVELFERYGKVELPEVQIVNVSFQRKQKNGGHFSPLLLKEVEDALVKKEQVILFQNRRGFSPYVECKECGWIPQCEHCNVSLTYHKRTNQLVCHYCGFTIAMPHVCLACGGSHLETKGFGTEKVEEELQLIFPHAVVERMDLDTTRTRSAYERIISDFENRNIDILVGTQMVTKGLDFDNVSLVGILNADNLLSFPDFRAGERSYQLMSQVAGRAGRRGKRGRVLVQTVQPRHEILQHVLHGDYKGMYASQMSERHDFLYPPFTRLIKITMKHRDEKTLFHAAKVANQSLRNIFAHRISPPVIPLINRVHNRYIINFLLKIEREKSTEKAKLLIKDIFAQIMHIAEFKQVEIITDVDPM
jgi:primosomal protein N' (replication factor Y)